MFARLTADFPKTDNGLTAVADLSVDLEAGKRYLVDGTFFVSANSLNGFKLDLGGGDATFTDVKAGATAVGNNTGGAATALNGDLNSKTAVADVNKNIISPSLPVRISGTVEVNAAGTLVPRFAQHGTNPTASVLLKDSFWSVTEIV